MRVRPWRREDGPPAGEESFLDAVANLVGVLIILLVIVSARGAQIQDAATRSAGEAETEELSRDVEAMRERAVALHTDHDDLKRGIARERQLADLRQRERHLMLVQIESARAVLRDRMRELSADQQEVLEQTARIDELERALSETRIAIEAHETMSVERETIEHYPTPIAKTVFSDEIHFRLREGRLAWVPMDELVQLMKNEWEQKSKKLDLASETLETVGPVGEFRLQYQLRAEEEVISTGYGRQTVRVPRFTRFVLLPTSEPIGVPLDAALASGSDFRQRLESVNPDRTTVSVWVYPDSFEQFNELKRGSRVQGFRTACWPLSADSPIAGSPAGYRSVSQ